jgi:hypothetical protein
MPLASCRSVSQIAYTNCLSFAVCSNKRSKKEKIELLTLSPVPTNKSNINWRRRNNVTMASLQPPLIIIDNKGSQRTSKSTVGGSPPAATWFDDDNRHFVALSVRRDGADGGSGGSLVSGMSSVDSLVIAGEAEGQNEDGDVEDESEVSHFNDFYYMWMCCVPT